MSRLVAGLLLLPLAVAAVPAPAFALRAVGLEEGKERERVAEILNVPASARPAPTQLTGLEEAKELTLEETQAKLGVAPPVGATHGLWVPAPWSTIGDVLRFLRHEHVWISVVDERIANSDVYIPATFQQSISIATSRGGSFVGNTVALALGDAKLDFITPPSLTVRLNNRLDAGTLDFVSILSTLRTARDSMTPAVIYWHSASAKPVELDGREGYLFYA